MENYIKSLLFFAWKMKASVIVPVYNEESRIKPFLNELKHNSKSDWEVIFVDDGSNDNTLDILKKFEIINKRIISYKKNKGKGFAVKTGVMAAKGDYIIFIDADGSIHTSQIDSMLEYLKRYEVVVGTRASKDSKVKQSFLRKIIGITFNIYVNLLYNVKIKDNLCGFKGFRSDVAKKLFTNLLSERWIFDVELFYKIREEKISLYQMPIEWKYRPNSKMKFIDPFKMAFELLFLRLKLLK
jgi:dolichyl-phosphate beta-glucosyltransferase